MYNVDLTEGDKGGRGMGEHEGDGGKKGMRKRGKRQRAKKSKKKEGKIKKGGVAFRSTLSSLLFLSSSSSFLDAGEAFPLCRCLLIQARVTQEPNASFQEKAEPNCGDEENAAAAAAAARRRSEEERGGGGEGRKGGESGSGAGSVCLCCSRSKARGKVDKGSRRRVKVTGEPASQPAAASQQRERVVIFF